MKYSPDDIINCAQIDYHMISGARCYKTLNNDVINIDGMIDADVDIVIDEIERLRGEFTRTVCNSFNDNAKTPHDCDVWWDYVSDLANRVYGPEIARLENTLYPVKTLNQVLDEEPAEHPVWRGIEFVLGSTIDPAKLPIGNKWLNYAAVDMTTKKPNSGFTIATHPVLRNGHLDNSGEYHKLGIVKREVFRILRKAANNN